MITGPFLEVIRSEDTSGPVTELALSAVFKFLSYGLIGIVSFVAAIEHNFLISFIYHSIQIQPMSQQQLLWKVWQMP